MTMLLLKDDVEDFNVEEEDECEDNGAEEEVDDDDVAEARWRMAMLKTRMTSGRKTMIRTKVMILRLLMWRRRTDRKTGTTVLCQPAHSKFTWTCDKPFSFSCENVQVKGLRPRPRPPSCASVCIRNAHGGVTRTIFAEIQTYKAADQTRRAEI